MKFFDYFITYLSFLRHSEKRKLIKYCFSFKGKKGLEIGGPSSLFSLKGHFPIYLFLKGLDGVNFNNETIWEGRIEEGNNFSYYKSKGYQYIKEATQLDGIANNAYDFVLSCHSLEHVANPVKALHEWSRVLKEDGLLVLVLPDKRFMFDRDRPYTTFSHLIQDAENGIDEDDETHFDEVITTNPQSKVAEKRTFLLEEIKNNVKNRYVHHHVFSFDVIAEMLGHCGFDVLYQQTGTPFHLITIAKKKS